jgi:ADP-heptose:LPS heptosyltransferase
MNTNTVKFLVIRFSSIGDIVLTSPVVRCLKQQVEGAEVHFLTKKQFAPLVNNNPFIDKVFLFDSNLNDIIRQLKEEEYDYIIDLHNNIRTAVVKARLQGMSFTFNKLNIAKWLLVHTKINRMPNEHIVDRYLATLSVFDVMNDGLGLNYFIPEKDEVDIKSLPAEYQNGFIALVIGANHATKILPDSSLIRFCNIVDKPVLLIGGKGESKKGDFIIDHTTGLVLNTCGQYGLNQSASLLKQASVVVTHDTGMMHIAAALKKRIISIWGNTVPEFGMTPYFPSTESVLFEVKGLACRPCSKLGYKKCPKGHFNCMNTQPLEEIASTARHLFIK